VKQEHLHRCPRLAGDGERNGSCCSGLLRGVDGLGGHRANGRCAGAGVDGRGSQDRCGGVVWAFEVPIELQLSHEGLQMIRNIAYALGCRP